MAITHSAKKALRSSLKKRVFNTIRKDKVTKTVKVLKKLINEKKKKEAMIALREVQRALDKAVKGKTLKKNFASRKTSRFSKMIKKIA